MKKKYGLLSTCIALASVQAQALELTDYTNPVSEYTDAEISLQLNARDGNQDQSSYDLNLLGDIEKNYSSDDMVWQWNADAVLNANRGENKADKAEQGYSVNTSVFYNDYINDDGKLFWFTDGALGFRKLNGANSADDPFAKVGAGVGYGRIINATPLAYTLRLMEELKELGILAKEPSNAALLEVAQIISKEREYKSADGGKEYRRRWYADIEAVLVKDGALQNGTLGAMGTVALNNVLFEERTSTRKYGWKAQAGVGYILSNYDGSDPDPTLDALFEYALPLTRQLQFTNIATASALLTDDTDYLLKNDMSLTYEVSDTVDWENGWRHTSLLNGESNVKNVHTNETYTTFSLEVNSQLDFDITFLLTHVDDHTKNGNEKVDKSLFIGITHEFY